MPDNRFRGRQAPPSSLRRGFFSALTPVRRYGWIAAGVAACLFFSLAASASLSSIDGRWSWIHAPL
jgi:hypothetical protein